MPDQRADHRGLGTVSSPSKGLRQLLILLILGFGSSGASAAHIRAVRSPSCPSPAVVMINMALDEDGDGWYSGLTRDTCIVAAFPPNPHLPFRYYRGADGHQYIDVSTAMGGGDCNDIPGAVGRDTYRLVSGGSDPDHTGSPLSGTIGIACVGNVSFFDNGYRYYYRGGSDQSTWLDERDFPPGN